MPDARQDPCALLLDGLQLLGVHYPADVAAGIILGAAWTAGVIRWSTSC